MKGERKMAKSLTPEEARMIIEIHDVETFMQDQVEVECLEANNPVLLMAYRKLIEIAKRRRN